MKKKLMTGLMLILIFSTIGAQQEPVNEEPSVAMETLELMKKEGMTAEEEFAFQKAIRSRNWEEAEGAEPEMLVLALKVAKKEHPELTGEEAAELCLQISLMTNSMRKAGFSRQETSRAAMNGTREAVLQINSLQTREQSALQTGTQQQQLQQQLTERIRKSMKEAAADEQKKAEGMTYGSREKRDTFNSTGSRWGEETERADVSPGSGKNASPTE